jgi:transcriptional regulator with XRE-family HTH domain
VSDNDFSELPKKEDVAERIRQVIIKSGLTSASFAASIGMKTSTISDYRSGRIYPSVEVLMRMQYHYGISVDWLLFGISSQASNKMAEMIARLPEVQREAMRIQVEALYAALGGVDKL